MNSPVTGEERPSPSERLRDEALGAYRQSDTFAGVAVLTGHSDPRAAGEAFVLAMRQLYWKEKNLAAAIAFGRAGVQHSLSAAERAAEADECQKLRSLAKGLAYDLASFTWPGWNEPGITISAADVALGLDAAKANLRLARELDKGDLPLSRAHWMLGAQQLACREYPAARASFHAAAEHARKAGVEAEGLLAEGFAALTEVIHAEQPEAAKQSLAAIITRLKPLPDGEFFAGQLTTAEQVFRPGK